MRPVHRLGGVAAEVSTRLPAPRMHKRLAESGARAGWAGERAVGRSSER